jgi:hypothetical protein
VTQRFGNQKYMQAMGRVNHALKVPRFYFLLNLGVGERIFFHFSFILNMFLPCSFKFPMGSQWQLALIPYVSATYTIRPKGRAFLFFDKMFYFGEV